VTKTPPPRKEFPPPVSIVRFLDAALNGKDHRANDRALLEEAVAIAADFPAVAAAADRFRRHTVRYLTETAGIRQFVDCAPGLPDTKTVTYALTRFCRVLYIEPDEVALSHSRALLDRDGARTISAPPYNPVTIRAHEDAGVLDWDKPIGLLHSQAWLRAPEDAAAIADSMKRFVAELPAGSYTASCHLQLPSPPNSTSEQVLQATDLQDLLTTPLDGGWFRTRAQIEAMFPDQEFTAAGLAPALQLLGEEPGEPGLCDFLIAGIGRVLERGARAAPSTAGDGDS
jgi:hypothetical protein